MKLKKHLPDWLYKYVLSLYNRFMNPFYQKSYAQEGEDLILYRMIYGKIEKGFYIDVGAHHPKRFSNTYFFYKQGWRGINIEPMRGSKRKFDKIRPRDINLEIPINSKEEELTYYIFNDPALNGFSKDLSSLRNQSSDYKIIKTVNMKTRTLSSVLNEYLSAGQKINLLSIDVEGLDFEVLKSNDWRTYKPDFIMVEDKEFNIAQPDKSAIYNFLQDMNYQLLAKTLSTLIFSLK